MNVFLNIPGSSIASPSYAVATFCLSLVLGSSALLCVSGHLFGDGLGGGFPIFITAYQ